MTLPTMEGINTATPNSAAPLDLTTPESEAAKAAAAAAKASQLADQTNASASSPGGMDGITPAPSPATPESPIGVGAMEQSAAIKPPASVMPTEPSTPTEALPVANPGALGSSPIAAPEPPTVARVAEQPPKKPGLFGKLFGKK